jgi:serine/threonine protein kinase/Tol biopolymer transport system component
VTLTPGTRLGPYEITTPIGAGGMGEVYRAHDTRLGRDVAIKVLPPAFSANPQVRARFEREARVISSLSHPHICALYDVGHQEDGTDFLVMELIEGETLAERLQRGALPLEQILRYGGEIADALDKAHRRGVVHRDLKPSNIILTKSGAKLLDFGLAKPFMSSLLASGTSETLQMTVSRPLTEEGTIVGTFQYMAPEQLELGEADTRSDIFTFGAVLYEMATGRRAFEGKSRASTIAQILEHDPPPITSIQPLTPLSLERVVATCLAKNPDERFQTAHDLMLQLRWIRDERSTPSSGVLPLARRRSARETIAWSAAALLAIALIVIVAMMARRNASSGEPVVSSVIAPANGRYLFTGDNGGGPSISPDGRTLAFVAVGEDASRGIWLRPLGSADAKKIEGTAGAMAPFWSPDGRSLGFFADAKLKTIDVGGGVATTIAPAADARGGVWLDDGTIVYEPVTREGLFRVSAGGGTPARLTKPDGKQITTHRWPIALPGGKWILYLAASHFAPASPDMSICALSTDGVTNKRLFACASNVAYVDGRLLFVRDGALLAQPFDKDKLELSGRATTVVPRVRYDVSIWRGVFDASSNGVLAYQEGGDPSGSRISFADVNGKPIGALPERGKYFDIAFAPDGERLAMTVGDPQANIWIIDVAKATRTRLTFDSDRVASPVWSADGAYIYYTAGQGLGPGFGNICRKAVRGGTPREVLATDTTADFIVCSLTKDAKTIFASYGTSTASSTIVAVDLSGANRKPVPLVARMTAYGPYLSPDGKWIAFTGIESDHEEVYVIPYPLREGQWQVSNGGGRLPRWSADGKKLRFVTLNHELAEVDVDGSSDAFVIGAQRKLFRIDLNAYATAPYDISRNGTVAINGGEGDALPLTLVTNWRVPAAR